MFCLILWSTHGTITRKYQEFVKLGELFTFAFFSCEECVLFDSIEIYTVYMVPHYRSFSILSSRHVGSTMMRKLGKHFGTQMGLFFYVLLHSIE